MSVPSVFRSASDLRGFALKSMRPHPFAAAFLMCPPDYFEVAELKNPFLTHSSGRIDKAAARRQWEELRAAFEAAGKTVEIIDPVPGFDEMTLCANQALTGLSDSGEKICVPGRMLHPARRREVPAFERWFAARGYRLARLRSSESLFEGSGDAIWHPGRRFLWGGYGFRSEAGALEEAAAALGAPLGLLKLVNERFYHLDSCFCPLNAESVLIHAPAFAAESLELIVRIFPVVISIPEKEAGGLLALNGCAIEGRVLIVQKGAQSAVRHAEALGLKTIEVDTSEFAKSGGSVYCLKNLVF